MKGHLTPSDEATEAIEAFVSHREALLSGMRGGAISSGREACHALSDATDAWIARMWEIAAEGQFSDAALIALGGYGRRELSWGSDIDLVVQLPDAEVSGPLADSIERFMAWARVARVKLSHAVRTPPQTEEAFHADFRTAVSYLDARPVLGTASVGAREAIEHLRADDEGRVFAAAMLEAYRQRLDRFGQTIYLLEPDVKSGKGALRDLHLTRWVGLVRGDGVDIATTPCDALCWGELDIAAFANGNEWLLRVRGLLHVLHERKHDRMHFPDQERLAPMLLERDIAGKLVESLMRQHYRTTRTNAKLTERALRRWSSSATDEKHEPSAYLRIVEGQVELVREHLEPQDVFEALRFAARHDLLLDPDTERRIEAAVAAWPARVRTDPAVGAMLRDILTERDTTPRTSTRLLELTVLQTVVPEFEPVVCHVQHDVYHVYTTDVHLLQCLESARELLNGEGPGNGRWPAFGQIAGEIDDEVVFLLAALFHDIGKNRGGGHSEKGAAMMEDVGPRLGLDDEQTTQLAFLVREHLSLSHAARRHDLSDRRVVRDLAAKIRTMESLNQLTALTFCDMLTVAPTVMNDWNASLLLQLHHILREAIQHGVEEAWRRLEADVASIRDWLVTRLREDSITRSRVDAFVRDLPAVHLVESAPESLLLQYTAYAQSEGTAPIVLVRPEPESGSTEVVVSSPDIPGALAQITGAISSLGLNILDARLVTTASGRLLDIFRVAQSGGASHALNPGEQRAVTDEVRLDRLGERLRSVLVGDESVEELLKRRIAEKRLPPRATPEVETVVERLEGMSDDYTVLQIRAPDRIGLLYEIAQTLVECDVDIRLSKIDSVGTQIVDTFYVETVDGEKLTEEHVERTIAALRDVIEHSRLGEQPT